ncbi:MAG TPA: hypothetical protein VFT54_08940, partial [Acidimicrobiia bacterium]|nr:hypothetical protein [Acidimicrobiia bacterium]
EMAARSQLTGMAINVVASETVAIRELAEHIVHRFPTELKFGPPRPGDVPPALVSAERAKQMLGWRSLVSFTKGLDELIDDVLRGD